MLIYMAKDSTNIYMKKDDAGIVRMEASQLGYDSPAALINALVNLRKSNKWSKLDVEILTVYHRLPEVTILTEAELKRLGYKKVEFTETGPKVVADVAQPFQETVNLEVSVKKPKEDE